jgi:hypothetical protein
VINDITKSRSVLVTIYRDLKDTFTTVPVDNVCRQKHDVFPCINSGGRQSEAVGVWWDNWWSGQSTIDPEPIGINPAKVEGDRKSRPIDRVGVL